MAKGSRDRAGRAGGRTESDAGQTSSAAHAQEKRVQQEGGVVWLKGVERPFSLKEGGPGFALVLHGSREILSETSLFWLVGCFLLCFLGEI